MNQNDIKLALSIIIISLFIFVFIFLTEENGTKTAVVYRENKEVLKIDLTDHNGRYYDVKGNNGNVKIYTRNGMVKVVEENSKNHICSNMGYISKSYESIVCLPNKVVIKIVADTGLDTIVR